MSIVVAQEVPVSLEAGTGEVVWEMLLAVLPVLLLFLVIGMVVVVRHRRMTPLAADE